MSTHTSFFSIDIAMKSALKVCEFYLVYVCMYSYLYRWFYLYQNKPDR